MKRLIHLVFFTVAIFASNNVFATIYKCSINFDINPNFSNHSYITNAAGWAPNQLLHADYFYWNTNVAKTAGWFFRQVGNPNSPIYYIGCETRGPQFIVNPSFTPNGEKRLIECTAYKKDIWNNANGAPDTAAVFRPHTGHFNLPGGLYTNAYDGRATFNWSVGTDELGYGFNMYLQCDRLGGDELLKPGSPAGSKLIGEILSRIPINR